MICSGCMRRIPLVGSSMLRLTGQSDKHFCTECTILMITAIDAAIKDIPVQGMEMKEAKCTTRG